MTDELFVKLVKRREQAREWLIGESAEPRHVGGSVLVNPLVSNLSKEELYNRGMKSWSMVAMATIISCAEEVGWAAYLDMLDQYQRPAMKRTADVLVEDFGITGKEPLDCHALAVVWAKGCGFVRHTTFEASPDGLYEGADMCPQIEALHAMEMTDETGDLPYWCDAYDDLIGQSLNLGIQYSHVQCIGQGDGYCKSLVFSDSSRGPQETFGEKVVRLHDEMKSRDVAAGTPPPPPVQGMHFTPASTRDWTPEMRWRDGVKTKGRIAHDNLIIGAKALGWESFLTLVASRQSWGHSRHAVRQRAELDSRGNTLQDAANMAMFGYTSMGFDWHNVVEYTEKRFEVVAKRCPIIDSAEHLGLLDSIEDMSLWCDWYHNHNVHAVRPDLDLVHTHCLARGDSFCRACMH